MFQTLDVSDAQEPRPSPSSPPETFPSQQLKLFFYHSSFPSISPAAIIPKSNPFEIFLFYNVRLGVRMEMESVGETRIQRTSLLHCALCRLTLYSLKPYTVLYSKKTVGFERVAVSD